MFTYIGRWQTVPLYGSTECRISLSDCRLYSS